MLNKVSTANIVLRLISRICETHANTDVIKKLYIHLVRPHLDYTSQVWSPHQAYLSNMIEGVQRRATKLMVGNKLSSDRLLKTGLMSISSRRIDLDLPFLFKYLHGHYDLDVSGYLQCYELEHESYNLRNTELTFKSMYATKSDTSKYSFFPRVVRSWNKFPISVEKSDSVSKFKQELKLLCLQIDHHD